MVEEMHEVQIDLNQVLVELEDNTGNKLRPEQVSAVLALDHFKSKDKVPMLIAEFGQLLLEMGFERAYYVLSNSPVDEDFTWTSPTLDELKKFVETVQMAELSVIARDDLGFCTKCKSKMITVTYKQTSRGDEATSTIYRCAACKAGEKYIKLVEGAKDIIKQLIKGDSK